MEFVNDIKKLEKGAFVVWILGGDEKGCMLWGYFHSIEEKIMSSPCIDIKFEDYEYSGKYFNNRDSFQWWPGKDVAYVLKDKSELERVKLLVGV